MGLEEALIGEHPLVDALGIVEAVDADHQRPAAQAVDHAADQRAADGAFGGPR